MALFNDVSAMVAAARPKQTGPNTGGQSLNVGNAEQGYGPWGENLAKGFGEATKQYWDSDTIRQQAKQTSELMLKMPDELKAQVYSNPDVQDRLKRYYKLAPEMFADAGFVMSNEQLKGKLAFVGDEEYSAKMASTKATTEGKQAETGLRQAQTVGAEQENEVNLLLKDAKIAAAKGDIAKATALTEQAIQATAASKSKQGIDESAAPLERNLLKAQANAQNASAIAREKKYADLEAQLALREQAQALRNAQYELKVEQFIKHSSDDNESRVWKGFEMPFKALNKDFELYHRKTDYVVGQTNLVRNQIVNAMGQKTVELEDGSTGGIPIAITNGPMVAMVHKTFDTNYHSLIDAKKEGKDADILRIADESNALWEASYAPVLPIMKKLNAADTAIVNKFNSKTTPAEALFIRMEGERVRAKMEGRVDSKAWKDKEQMYVAAIKAAGGLPTEITPPSWVDSVLGVFKGKAPADNGISE